MRSFVLASNHRRARLWLLAGATLMLSACRPPKSVDFYRTNDLVRDSTVNHCLATNGSNRDCENAIAAEAERWGTKDSQGFTVTISDDNHPIDAVTAPQAGAPAQQAPRPAK